MPRIGRSTLVEDGHRERPRGRRGARRPGNALDGVVSQGEHGRLGGRHDADPPVRRWKPARSSSGVTSNHGRAPVRRRSSEKAFHAVDQPVVRQDRQAGALERDERHQLVPRGRLASRVLHRRRVPVVAVRDDDRDVGQRGLWRPMAGGSVSRQSGEACSAGDALGHRLARRCGEAEPLARDRVGMKRARCLPRSPPAGAGGRASARRASAREAARPHGVARPPRRGR